MPIALRRSYGCPYGDGRATVKEVIYNLLSHAARLHSLWSQQFSGNSRKLLGTVLFVSGEPETPGHRYRVARQAAVARDVGYETRLVTSGDVERAFKVGGQNPRLSTDLVGPDLVVIWRAVWSEPLKLAIDHWRRTGARIVYDIDDYMFEPRLAKAEFIDAIRGLSLEEEALAELYSRVNRVMVCCDAGMAPTETLARAIRRHGLPAYVVPNGFDGDSLLTSRRARAERTASKGDGLVRIGYAAGSRTHQRDFGVAVAAVAEVLRARPMCRLVMFQAEAQGLPLVDLSEYPELSGLQDQIEWRMLRPLEELPLELARFDINLAPLEVGNPFCEAKSELKLFEAALVEVPTSASPTPPFSSAIIDGKSGFLARTKEEWHAALVRLVDNCDLRRSMGRMAYLSVLWNFGPDGRRQKVDSVYAKVMAEPAARSREFSYGRSIEVRRTKLPALPETEELFCHETGEMPDVAVVIPCYNYARFVTDALDSVAAQHHIALELVVVDDSSTDISVSVVHRWIRLHASRFVRCRHLRTTCNSGLSLARNAGFGAAEAAFVFPLDADNMLTPDSLRLLLNQIVGSSAAAAHPTLRRFGQDSSQLLALPWDPDRLKRGNYIDAMALIRKSAWSHVGGYEPMPLGWEDYDLWCLFAEAGLWSAAVPEAVALYRVHDSSMLHSTTDLPDNRSLLIDCLEARHPWLDISRS